MAQDPKLSALLQNLIEGCRRCEQGFATAARVVGDAQLKILLRACAGQRRRFASELEGIARDQSTPVADVGESNTLSRGEPFREQDVLASCWRIEEYVLQEYQRALESRLAGSARFVVQAQYGLLRKAYDQLRSADRPILSIPAPARVSPRKF